MKKNNRGFMITEALIVSTIVVGVLVFMYAQFRSVANSFNQTFKYNTVENIYKTNEIKKFIETDATDNMISLLEKEESNYLDITNCDLSIYNNVNFCKQLYKKLEVKTVLLLAEDVSNVTEDKMANIGIGTKNFLNYIKNNYTGNYHRVVVTYNDGTYSTLRIDILRNVYNYSYTGNVQTFTAPIDGYYQVELWGASGGSAYYNYTTASTGGHIGVGDLIEGGRGGYTNGIIHLRKNEKVYIYVGGRGVNGSPTTTVKGGYNGGGNGVGYYQGGASGGGATDIRLSDGLWNDFDSLKTRIMVASAGAGASNYSNSSSGGAGGTLIGNNGNYNNYNSGNYAEHILATGGTQTAGGTGGGGNFFGEKGKFGIGGSAGDGHGSGAGAGYYGGGGSSYTNALVSSGAGGSSFISGYDGCDAISENSTESNIIHTGQSIHYSGYKFEYGQMIAGDSVMPNPNGGTMIGNSGDGYARITMISG